MLAGVFRTYPCQREEPGALGITPLERRPEPGRLGVMRALAGTRERSRPYERRGVWGRE